MLGLGRHTAPFLPERPFDSAGWDGCVPTLTQSYRPRQCFGSPILYYVSPQFTAASTLQQQDLGLLTALSPDLLKWGRDSSGHVLRPFAFAVIALLVQDDSGILG